jgi:hypothetical protein
MDINIIKYYILPLRREMIMVDKFEECQRDIPILLQEIYDEIKKYNDSYIFGNLSNISWDYAQLKIKNKHKQVMSLELLTDNDKITNPDFLRLYNLEQDLKKKTIKINKKDDLIRVILQNYFFLLYNKKMEEMIKKINKRMCDIDMDPTIINELLEKANNEYKTILKLNMRDERLTNLIAYYEDQIDRYLKIFEFRFNESKKNI